MSVGPAGGTQDRELGGLLAGREVQDVRDTGGAEHHDCGESHQIGGADLDGDGVADFAGGFAAAAALLGNEPELYHVDTSQTQSPKARRIAEETGKPFV